MNQPGPAEDDEVSPAGAEGSASQTSSLAVSDGEPAADAPSPRVPQAVSQVSGWMRTSFIRQLGILVGFLVAGIVFTWPRTTYLFGHKLPNTRDSGSAVWGFWWVARQVEHFGNPWVTHYQAAPVGTQLAFHTLMPLPGVLMLPITAAFGPSASYNLLSALVPGLMAYAMYRAARLWLPPGIPAVAAGVFYGLSSMLAFQSWYLVNLALGAMFIPLAVEAAVRLQRRPGWRTALYLGVVLGAALLTDQESAILTTIVTVLTLLPWLVFGPRWSKRSDTAAAGQAKAGPWMTVWYRLWPVALAAVVTLVVGSPQIIAMLQQTASGGAWVNAHFIAQSDATYGTGLLGLFAPSPRVATFGMHSIGALFYSHGMSNPLAPLRKGAVSQLQAPDTPMFGIILPILALVGLVVSWRRRSAWLLALLMAACAVIALGPTLWIGSTDHIPFPHVWNGVAVSMVMPYTWIIHFPGMSNFREANRFAELGLVAGALLAGAAVQWLRQKSWPVLAVVLVVSILELGWSGNPPGQVMPSALRIGTMPTSMPKIDNAIAADHSDSIVVDFPFGIRGGPPVYGQAFAPETEVLATADGHPLGDALISRVPMATYNGINDHRFYAALEFADHDPKETLYTKSFPYATRDARRMNVGWVIVWPASKEVLRSVEHYLTGTGFKFAYRVHEVMVYHR